MNSWLKYADCLLEMLTHSAPHKASQNLARSGTLCNSYHQVRQRWSRKFGEQAGSILGLDLLFRQPTTFEADLASVHTASPAQSQSSHNPPPHMVPNPKLGLAPFSSDLSTSNRPLSSGAGP